MNLYHKRFLDSFASENVIGLFSRYRGSHKEVTESWAMMEAANKFVTGINDCKVFVIGDGASPRTGSLFAYFSKADVVSIDPQFNMDHWREHATKQSGMGNPVQRLALFARPVEEMEAFDCKGSKAVVVWPHSHAHMNNFKCHSYSKRIDIAMPCCVKIPANWMIRPHITYDDQHVLSPHRTIHIWEPDIL